MDWSADALAAVRLGSVKDAVTLILVPEARLLAARFSLRSHGSPGPRPRREPWRAAPPVRAALPSVASARASSPCASSPGGTWACLAVRASSPRSFSPSSAVSTPAPRGRCLRLQSPPVRGGPFLRRAGRHPTQPWRTAGVDRRRRPLSLARPAARLQPGPLEAGVLRPLIGGGPLSAGIGDLVAKVAAELPPMQQARAPGARKRRRWFLRSALRTGCQQRAASAPTLLSSIEPWRRPLSCPRSAPRGSRLAGANPRSPWRRPSWRRQPLAGAGGSPSGLPHQRTLPSSSGLCRRARGSGVRSVAAASAPLCCRMSLPRQNTLLRKFFTSRCAAHAALPSPSRRHPQSLRSRRASSLRSSCSP